MSNEERDEQQPEIIYIPDDEGNEEEFEVLMKFEVDGSDVTYIMVIPVDSDEDTDEVYAFRYEEDDNGDDLTLYTIDNEDEWKIVEETFHTLLAEMDEEENT